MLTYRTLSREEFDKIPSEALGGFSLKDKDCEVAAAVDEFGKVQAVWSILSVVHLEPVWVAEEYRHSATILRRLWELVADTMRDLGLTTAVAVIPEEKVALHKIAAHIGAEPIPGKLYMVHVEGEK